MREATWWGYLDEIYRSKKPAEKRSFEEAVDVRAATLRRWKNGEDVPKAENLERLLLALTDDQRSQMLNLMSTDAQIWQNLQKIDSAIWKNLPQSVRASTQAGVSARGDAVPLQQESLGDFALRVLELQRIAWDQQWELSNMILREALKRLETHPVQVGLEIIIATCMPPRGGKVRSLRFHVAMGTPPYPREDLHTEELFFGAQSLAGFVVAERHGEMIPDLNANALLSAQVRGYERSATAFPIMSVRGIAGALLVSSTQPNYFTTAHMMLIETLADIARLTFSDHDFVSGESIDLFPMPPGALQHTYFATFAQRVVAEGQKGPDTSIAERHGIRDRVRAQLEEELLRHAGGTPEASTPI